jgi:hypothetical protein
MSVLVLKKVYDAEHARFEYFIQKQDNRVFPHGMNTKLEGSYKKTGADVTVLRAAGPALNYYEGYSQGRDVMQIWLCGDHPEYDLLPMILYPRHVEAFEKAILMINQKHSHNELDLDDVIWKD